MYLLKSLSLFVFLFSLSCSSGGALTPAESFNAIKCAVEKNDSEIIVNYLTEASIKKISRLNLLIKEMRSDQLTILSARYGFAVERLGNIKFSDAVFLYFFSDVTEVKLNSFFKENIVSIDISGGKAIVKTESGVELDFLREGPYWKFDMSNL